MGCAAEKMLVYPEPARKAGVEGTFYRGILIDENGVPIKTQVLKRDCPAPGFEEAAAQALMITHWKNPPTSAIFR